MDELVRATGLGKATVYRLFPTKDALVGAYLQRLATGILGQIDAQAERAEHPASGCHVLAAVAGRPRSPGVPGVRVQQREHRVCDPQHAARVAAREYRSALHERLRRLAERVVPRPSGAAATLAGQLATLVDGAYTSAAHLGPAGPAAAGMVLAHGLVDHAAASAARAGAR